MRSAIHRRWPILLACVFLVGCAGTQSRDTDPENDPWEGYNRKIHAFNTGVDRYILRPVAVGYDTITPEPLQRGIGNFFRNLRYPVTALNQILQGKFGELGESTERFLANTFFGFLGFSDVASKHGLPDHDEDLGQTMATWGWADSRYFVLPFLGPSTVRDTLGRSTWGYMHPLNVYVRREGNYWPLAFDVVQFRASLLDRDRQVMEAYDPYVFVRDAWLQRREFLIYDGNPPEPDYDAYLQELEE